MNELPVIKSQNIYYVDTNAIINLWDKFVLAEKEGDSNLDISKTVFNNVFISEYVVDELLNFTADNLKSVNALKKNLCLLAILWKIPVIISFPKISAREKLDVAEQIVPTNQIQEYVSSLLLHLSGVAISPEIEKVLEEKKTMKMVSEWFVKPHTSPTANYCKLENRTDIDAHINNMLKKYNTNRPSDYQNFCMETYSAIRDRKIKCPEGFKGNKFFKNSKSALNQQFDFYHLCYAKYVDVFITDDQVLKWFAGKLKDHEILDSKVMSSDEFYGAQIEKLLTENV